MRIMLSSCVLTYYCLAVHPRFSTALIVHSTRVAASSSRRSLLPTSRTSRAMSSSSETEMIDVAGNLAEVQQRISDASAKAGRAIDSVSLIAVSKTKPLELLQQVYDANHRVFGENYAQELMEKAAAMPNDIEWHYIGPLQSNKAAKLVKTVVPNSASLTIETVASLKLARKLNTAMQELSISDDKVLDIFIQVNTSGEESKSGVLPGEDCTSICREIEDNCDKLRLVGLMTIGAAGDLDNFDSLGKCRQEVASALRRDDLKLSMGMSGDFEQAIARGATHVRVGSTIFGARDYSSTK